jgi:hypothetical protein
MSRDVRRQSLRLFGLALLIVAFGISVSPAHAALLRGQLNRVVAGNKRVPVAGIVVTVYSAKNGRSPAVTTNASGMYYINVPPGPYSLEVWVTKPPRSYPIIVKPTTTDIPPITI